MPLINVSTNPTTLAVMRLAMGFRSSSLGMGLEIAMDKAILNSLLGQIATNLNFNISFGVKDVSQHQQQLILQAIAKAKENGTVF